MYVAQPILPLFSHDFGIAPATAGLALSVVVLAIALSSSVYGLLSDAFGRKPVMVATCLLLTVPTFACAFAPSFAWLLVFRALQGALIPGLSGVAVAYLGDHYQRAGARERGRAVCQREHRRGPARSGRQWTRCGRLRVAGSIYCLGRDNTRQCDCHGARAAGGSRNWAGCLAARIWWYGQSFSQPACCRGISDRCGALLRLYRYLHVSLVLSHCRSLYSADRDCLQHLCRLSRWGNCVTNCRSALHSISHAQRSSRVECSSRHSVLPGRSCPCLPIVISSVSSSFVAGCRSRSPPRLRSLMSWRGARRGVRGRCILHSIILARHLALSYRDTHGNHGGGTVSRSPAARASLLPSSRILLLSGAQARICILGLGVRIHRYRPVVSLQRCQGRDGRRYGRPSAWHRPIGHLSQLSRLRGAMMRSTACGGVGAARSAARADD